LSKYKFVEEYSIIWKVQTICKVIEVSRSGYYRWVKENRNENRKGDTEIAVKIAEVFQQSRRTYGARRIRHELAKKRMRIKERRISRLMKEMGLKVKTKKKFKITTDSDHKLAIVPNLLEKAEKPESPNKIWVGDITYIWTREGWLYLAVVMDLWSRKIVGWCLSIKIDKELVMEALKRAIWSRKNEPGLIFHSDKGRQYASNDYRALLEKNSIVQSMSGKGKCYDNAAQESFFHTLKTEVVYQQVYNTRKEAELSLFEYIECFYNRKRIHSSIGYMSPDSFEVENVK